MSRDAGRSYYELAREQARSLSDGDLLAAAQGCTELTCPVHGPLNAIARERRIGRFAEANA